MTGVVLGEVDRVLKASTKRLCEAYDLAMLDLDGVVYVGGDAVDGASQSIAEARDAGMHIAFVTNNAARPPRDVAQHLAGLGISTAESDVVTSAQAAASVLRDRFGRGARIAALGADGLLEAIAAEGMQAVGVDEEADAAATGYGPDVRWRDIMRIATRIRDGLPWVASNTDGSLPTPHGLAPGHGVLVEMLSRFTGVTPVVAGKPAPPLLRETIRRVGGKRPLMVGDRIDTDIEGGIAVDVDTLLVMTGVTGPAELAACRPSARPSYIAADVCGLLTTHDRPGLTQGTAQLGGWSARVSDGRCTVDGQGTLDDWWRVVAVAAWHWLDETGSPADLSSLTPPR